jgi:hypothetical protein
MFTFILVYSFISFPSGSTVVMKMPVADCTQATENLRKQFIGLEKKAKLVAVTCTPISVMASK